MDPEAVPNLGATTVPELKAVGVAGAGVMGRGIAQILAQSRYRVVLLDTADEILLRARQELRSGLRLYRMLHPVDTHESTSTILDRIQLTTRIEDFAEVDFVVENVTEKWDTKVPVYRDLDRVCQPYCIFAANTSAISVTRIASLTQRPDRVLGMHFMNPVPMIEMVEVIKGHHTSTQTLDTAKRLLATIGKQCVVVQDMPGFVSNRVLMLTVNEAMFLVQEGVASADEVDTIFRSCFGHKMGPLETADLIGLDTILYTLEVLFDSYKDGKFRPCPLLARMVAAGLHGRKTGRGFYEYAQPEWG